MALIALCFPILPGKKQKWVEMAAQLEAGPVKTMSDEARKKVGFTSARSFRQETPAGDVVIVTLEGDNRWPPSAR